MGRDRHARGLLSGPGVPQGIAGSVAQDLAGRLGVSKGRNHPIPGDFCYFCVLSLLMRFKKLFTLGLVAFGVFFLMQRDEAWDLVSEGPDHVVFCRADSPFRARCD